MNTQFCSLVFKIYRICTHLHRSGVKTWNRFQVVSETARLLMIDQESFELVRQSVEVVSPRLKKSTTRNRHEHYGRIAFADLTRLGYIAKFGLTLS